MSKVFVLGSLNMDITYYVDTLPCEGMTVSASGTAKAVGGKALNQAVACSYSGAEVNLVGAVGNDDNGRYILEVLKNYDINLNDISCCDKQTGNAFVLVDNAGKNLIVVDEGANRYVPEKKLDEEILKNDYIVAQLETRTETVKFYFETAKKSGAKTVLNLSPYCDGAEKLLPYTDFLIVNEYEASMFFKTKIQNAEDCIKKRKVIGEKKELTVIITLGQDGAVIITNGNTKHIKGNKVKAVDTQGAGDAFLGIAVGYLAQGMELFAAIETANSVASKCVEVCGSTVESLAQIGQEISR